MYLLPPAVLNGPPDVWVLGVPPPGRRLGVLFDAVARRVPEALPFPFLRRQWICAVSGKTPLTDFFSAGRFGLCIAQQKSLHILVVHRRSPSQVYRAAPPLPWWAAEGMDPSRNQNERTMQAIGYVRLTEKGLERNLNTPTIKANNSAKAPTTSSMWTVAE